MARRITTGRVGRPILGAISVRDNSVRTLETNQNLELVPDGTGIVQATSDLNIRSASSLVLGDTDDSHYVALKAPGTVTTSVTYTLPVTPTANYVLQTDASGNLSWVDISFEVANNTTSSTVHYPMITTSTSGNITGVVTSSGKLQYTPSSGTLYATISSGGTLTDGTLSISAGSITSGVNGTFTGTVQAATLTETSSIALKENVSPIDNALDKVLQLAGVIYDRKDGSSKNEAGLIAEDVNKVLPNLVKKDADGNPESIMYTKLSAYLIEAVKTLKSEIDKIKES